MLERRFIVVDVKGRSVGWDRSRVAWWRRMGRSIVVSRKLTFERVDYYVSLVVVGM